MKVLNRLTALLAAILIVGAVHQAQAQVAPRQPLGTAAAPQPAAAAQSGTSVAVIELQEVFKQNIRFKAAMDDIKKDSDALNAEMRTKQKELQKMLEQLKELKPGSPDYKAMEEQIAHTESNIRVDIQLRRKELSERQARLYYQAYQEVSHCVQQFATRNGIDLVLQFSSKEIDPSNPDSIMVGINRSVVFQRNLNITEYVIQMINEGTPRPQENTVTRPAPVIPGRR